MKKLLYSALALSATATGALASDDWSTLDQEIDALSASAAFDATGPTFGGRIRTLYENSGDFAGTLNPSDPANPGDLSDFDVLDARVKITGGRGGYSYVVQIDAGSGSFGNDISGADLIQWALNQNDADPDNDADIDVSDSNGIAVLDAYVEFSLGGDVNGRFGQFKPGVSRNGLLSSGKLFFIDRNVIGGNWSGRQEGFMLSGNFEQLGWSLTIQDGLDNGGDEFLVAGRIEFDLMGEGMGDAEGAFGGSEDPSATVALAFFDDGGSTDYDGTLLEFHAGTNVYSFGLDVMFTGDGFASIDNNLSTVIPDSTPISFSGTYMLQPETWEVGIRYQDFDSGLLDGSKIDLGVTNYLDGHNLKWTFQYSTMEAAGIDFDLLGLQLQVGF